MKNKTTITLVILLVILGIALFAWQGRDTGQKTKENELKTDERGNNDLERLSSLTFSDYQGNSVSLTDFEDKPLVVNSWAVWCPFCVKELEDFARLQEEFNGQIVVIAIDRAEPLEKAKSFTDNLKVTDKMIFWLDPSDSFYRAIGGFGMPETLFIDASGEIKIHKRGPMDFEEMKLKTEELLFLN